MPHNEHNVIPLCNKFNDSNGRMRYLPLYLHPAGKRGALLSKSYFDTLLRNHLSNAVYASDNISTALCILHHKIRRGVTHNTLFSKGKIIMVIMIIITLLNGYTSQEWLSA
jgi:hypothetical protein